VQVGLAVNAEAVDRPTGTGVDGNQESIVRPQQQPFVLVAVGPVGQASRLPRPDDAGVPAHRVRLRIVDPQSFSGHRVERHDLRQAGTQIHNAVDNEGGGFETVGVERRQITPLQALNEGQVLGLPGPGDGQVVEVVGVDLIER
jgi:hypothetical protein